MEVTGRETQESVVIRISNALAVLEHRKGSGLVPIGCALYNVPLHLLQEDYPVPPSPFQPASVWAKLYLLPTCRCVRQLD